MKKETCLLQSIADIAHCAGIVGFDASEALTAISRLTVGHFDRNRSMEKMNNDVLKAIYDSTGISNENIKIW